MILRSKVTVWHFKYRDQTRQCPCRGGGESFDRVLCWHHNSDTGQHYRVLGPGQHSLLHLLLLVPTHKKMKADGGLNRWSGEVRSYNVFLCGGTGYHTNWIRSIVTSTPRPYTKDDHGLNKHQIMHYTFRGVTAMEDTHDLSNTIKGTFIVCSVRSVSSFRSPLCHTQLPTSKSLMRAQAEAEQ